MKTLAQLRFPSSQRLAERLEHLPKRERILTVQDSDSNQEDVFIFRKVAALLITYHDACDSESSKAYDTLMEIDDSPWLIDITKRMKQDRGLHHYRIYLDDGPCYDFLAESHEYQTKGA